VTPAWVTQRIRPRPSCANVDAEGAGPGDEVIDGQVRIGEPC
jgi:hypothetical protein